MSNNLQPLRGMKDLLPKDFVIHKYISDIARNIGLLYGYEEMSTPILEYSKVFDRTLGESSDVVSKEMYSFLDKGGDSVALRPEFTAGIIRAILSNSLQQSLPLKLFSSGPVFRHDRPQAGRQRQFHQLNFEYIGDDSPYADAEIIKLATHILDKLELLSDLTLELNSLGCTDSKASYEKALVEYFSKYENDLSEDSKKRLQKNPLRILDSKDDGDKKISQDAPLMPDYFTDSAREYFDKVQEYLQTLGVKYLLNPRLARGLDYYSHTAFEFTTTKLGAQSTVLAGGRYDGLAELMGGKKIPAIGFAAGIERLSMMRQYIIAPVSPIVIMPIGQEEIHAAIALTDQLRNAGIITKLDRSGKIQKRMQQAIADSAKYVIFIGSDELANGNYKLKNLDSREENVMDIEELLKLFTQSTKMI